MQELSLSTIDGAIEYLKGLFEPARANFEKDGEVRPIAFLIGTVNPETGEDLKDPGIIMVGQIGMMADEEHKSEYASVLKNLVVATKAIGVITIMECWCVEGQSEEDRKRIEDHRKEHKSLEFCPGRKEAVLVQMEHIRAKGPVMYRAIIDRDKDGKGTLGEFQAYMNGDGRSFDGRSEGRFTGYLHSVN